MSNKNNYKFTFDYIRYSDIERINIPPICDEYAWKSNIDRLHLCPDIYPSFPCFFFFRSGDKLASYIWTLPDFLYYKKQKFPWAWSGGLVTEPEYRRKGLATNLLKLMTEVLLKDGISRGSTFSAAATIHIYKRLGQAVPGWCRRYVLFKSISPIIKAFISNDLVNSLGNFLYYLNYKAYQNILIKSLYLSNHIEINTEQIPIDFMHSISKYIDNQLYDVQFRFNDNYDKLFWKLKTTKKDLKMYIGRYASDNKPLFYFITKSTFHHNPINGKFKNFRLLQIMDYGFFEKPRSLYKFLIIEILNVFNKSNNDVLEIITSSPRIGSLASRFGMLKIGKGMSFTFQFSQSIAINQNYLDLSKWNLTPFCGDGFTR